MGRPQQISPRAPGSAGRASQYFYSIFVVSFVVWCLALIPGLQGVTAPKHGSLFPIRSRSAGTAALARFAELYDSIGGDAPALQNPSSSAVTVALPRISSPPQQVENPYSGAAIVTLAGGDTSGKHAIALIQSLRDVGTVLPIVVLLARGGLGSGACHNNTWRRINNRDHIQCTGKETIGA